jgi:hypothetical protein
MFDVSNKLLRILAHLSSNLTVRGKFCQCVYDDLLARMLYHLFRQVVMYQQLDELVVRLSNSGCFVSSSSAARWVPFEWNYSSLPLPDTQMNPTVESQSNLQDSDSRTRHTC